MNKKMTSYELVPAMAFATFDTHAEKPLLWVKEKGAYKGIKGASIRAFVLKVAHWLMDQGVTPGDTCAIISDNRPEWVIADLAIMAIGAAVVPIYPSLSPKETAYILNDSQAKVVFADTPKNLAKIPNPDPFAATVSFEGESWASILRLDIDPSAVNQVTKTLSSDTVASIVYTSGTTGSPKGTMLTHGNFLANVTDILEVMPLSESERVLSFLPLSHVFERTAGYYTVLAIGGQIYYAESMETVGDNIRETHPTVVVSVPRLYEKIQTKILNGLKGLKKTIFYWALKVGHQWFNLGNRSPLLHIKKKIAEILVYKKINKQTGGALRFFVSGGAPLAKEIGEFFHSLGLLIVEGYGMTETSPVVSCNRPNSFRFGTIGKALPSLEVKLSDDGELLVKGPSVMKGYYKKPRKTSEVLKKDGWLHTGDIATIDRQGFISIVDRKKEIIVLSNGKNVAPLVIEKHVGLSQYVSQVMVVGEKRNFVAALIVPEFEKRKAIEKIIEKSFASNEAFCTDPDVIAFYENDIEKRQKSLSRYEKVKKFVLMPEEFTQEAGYLTPTLKPKRKIIEKAFVTRINGMYDNGK